MMMSAGKNNIIFLAFTMVFSFLLANCSNEPHQEVSKKHVPQKNAESSYNPGIWFSVNSQSKEVVKNVANSPKGLDQLKTLGYLSGYKAASGRSGGGVTKYDHEAAYDGVNLLVSGHKPYAALMDMSGNVLHEWTYPYDRLGIKSEELIVNPLVDENFKNYWRRVFLYENGDILAIYDYQAMIKLDRDSKLVWAYSGRAHHDIFVDEKGDIWTFTAEKKNNPIFSATNPVLEDFICRLSPDGKEIEKISLIACFEHSEFSSFLHKVQAIDSEAVALDAFHSNSLQRLDGTLASRNPAFKKGNFLVSVRQLNLLAIIDPVQKKVVWVAEGPWKAQHEARLLPTGRILLFDNKGGGGFSRVMEIDPFSKAIEWSFQATPPESFFSAIVGSQQRLPNDNTLITDTVGGRAFEVSQGGETVWEFVSPYRSGSEKELIAALFAMVRYEKSYPATWLVPPAKD